MLEKYNQKRNFKLTKEPEGKSSRKSPEGFHYLIQKHAARRLHFDFRLELNGVLKSWAVPKGPSTDPEQKRLAVEVEDHPLEYGGFEGTIPQGQYGGGTVMLWDQGTWSPIGDADEGLKKGKLKFTIHGKRLQGTWNLVRSHSQKEEAKPVWFLIKSKDDDADVPGDPVDAETTSVVTGRTLDEIKTGASRVWNSKAKNHQVLEFTEPQLATLVKSPPHAKGWIHEIKFDGYRILSLLTKERDAQAECQLISRNEKNWTSKFPQIALELATLKCKSVILDGEMVVLDERGISSFQKLQNAFDSHAHTLFHYFIFDILYLDGKDLKSLPLKKRKLALANLLKRSPKNRFLKLSGHLDGDGSEILNHACRLGLEGVVSKRADRPYSSGRSTDWVKSKCEKRQEFVIVGYSHPKGSRTSLGALLLGVYDGDTQLRYAGRVGTGFNDNLLRSLQKKLSAIETDSMPLKEIPKGTLVRDVTWVKPKLSCEVKFASWTEDKVLRHPVFVALREDKNPEDIKVETPKDVRAPAKVSTVKITHPEKIMFTPDITKADLAHYYESVAPLILPHIKGRPISIVRCPDGHGKMCFFQKHPRAESRFISIDTVKDLIGYCQQGALEFHIWGSHFKNIEKPDVIFFDLDPDEGLPWKRVVDAALHLRDLLQEIKLESFLKTTGGKGLHLVVPITPNHNWDEIKTFTKGIATSMAKTFPDLYTATVSKKKRTGKLFIDYLRNTRGATAVAPYSTRARAHAPISVPLFWKELEAGAHSDDFNLRNIQLRFKTQKSDPWAKYFTVKQKLPKLKF